MLRPIILSLLFLLVPITSSFATYPAAVNILEKKDIDKLTDEQLINAYMDTLVDVNARHDYFYHFGFTGKELDDYKAVMKYRYLLLMEIHSRNLDIPQFERY